MEGLSLRRQTSNIYQPINRCTSDYHPVPTAVVLVGLTAGLHRTSRTSQWCLLNLIQNSYWSDVTQLPEFVCDTLMVNRVAAERNRGWYAQKVSTSLPDSINLVLLGKPDLMYEWLKFRVLIKFPFFMECSYL